MFLHFIRNFLRGQLADAERRSRWHASGSHFDAVLKVAIHRPLKKSHADI
jgi:hypothetical protein